MRKLATKLLVALGLLTSGGVSATAQSSETIFSFEAKSGVTLNLAANGGTQEIDETYATIENGSALIYNGKGSAADVITGGDVKLGGSGKTYIKFTLTGNTLQEGDVITLSAAGNWKMGKATNATDTYVSPYTVTTGDNLIGSNTIYVYKTGTKGDPSSFKTFTVLRPSADYVATPAISVSGATVTITCGTAAAEIFYTTDGTEPTSASTKYSSAITLTESATVRAIAIKGENKSEEEASKDVYVAGKGALATLGLNGGALNEDENVWTSTDGKFTLTDNTAGRTISYANLAGSQDGFKLNHNDEYVLQPAADIKVTKIVVVGKTWLQGDAGNASSISITGFKPERGTFYDYLSGGSTCVKTLTFTADETVGYGTAIPLKISNNQLGAYIEVYGELAPFGKAATVTWNLQVNRDETTVTTTSVSASRPSITDVTDLALTGVTVTSSAKDFATNKISTTTDKDENKYISMTFKVADGYMFTPSNVNLGIVSVTDAKKVLDVEISDASNSASTTMEVAQNAEPASTDFAFEGKSFTGTVTVKIYGYGGTSGYRLAPVITLTGDMAQCQTTYDNGWVSFTPSFDCAVTTEGAAAYIATKVAGSNVTMTKVEKMKAGNGYFLYAGSSEVKDLTVEIAEGATAPAENLIVGCTAATNVDGAANSIYCLGKLNGTAGLYKVSTSLEVPAGKAYLQAPLALKASVLNLVFSDSSEATAVKSINAQVEKNEAAVGTKHLLNGQIVIKTQNGFVNLMGVKVK